MGRLPSELLAASDADLDLLLALELLDPLDDPWSRSALTTATIAKANGSKRAKPDDYIPRAKLGKTADDRLAEVKAMQRRQKGRETNQR